MEFPSHSKIYNNEIFDEVLPNPVIALYYGSCYPIYKVLNGQQLAKMKKSIPDMSLP